ncbi:MAG: serine hydrolase [Gemmatimonadota bacterium]
MTRSPFIEAWRPEPQHWPAIRAASALCFLALSAVDLRAQQADLPLSGGLRFANYAHECERAVPLPEPTGHHQIGTVTYHWVDRSREETLSADTHDDRQVIASVFYPAVRVPDGPPAPYIPELDLLRAGFATDRREVPRRIADDLAIRGCVLTHVFVDRPVDDLEARYPIVLVSPGGNVSRHSHTALAQELASRGWVVAVMSHAYSGWDIFPEGGHVMSADLGDEQQTSMLAADASFVLDRLSELARDDPRGRFTGRLDTAHVAIVGHSRGGSTVGRACATDDRFDACVIFDNIGPDPETETGLRKPQLTVRRPWPEERAKRLSDFLGRNETVAFDAVVDGAVHMSFTDLPLFEPERHDSGISPERAHEIVSALTLAFIEEYALEGSRLEPPGLPEFPEVTLRTFGPAAPGCPRGSTGRTGAARALADSLGTAAYMLVMDGRVVDSYGDPAHEYRLHSVRKSLLGVLYGAVAPAAGTTTGAASDGGPIDMTVTIGALGIDDYAGLSPAERSATLADLLSSRSGVYLPATHENTGWDDVRPARGSHPPGERWFYSNWDFNAAGTAFQLMTGENLFRAFERKIAEPIGMIDFDVSDGAWRYGPRSRHPAYVFRMSTRDLARFGTLMANEGAWNGRQVVPAEWIRRITDPRSDVVRPDGEPMPGVGYGMMWWTWDEPATREVYGNLGEDVFVASGTGQQILLVAPDRNLVFVHRTDTDLPDEEYRSVSTTAAGNILKLLLGP